ncbi:ABC transporter ATP-binding protein [Methanosphaera cuniculi]|uniref:Teichoic acid ABC transporter ATP-binding protein n=1 Tax=Methanosphaera cuniculi TaxID=1077256 RepID=A0A2A2HDH5_9EURY|nr:ABC transporter ATP-binding protein [Methanosphaera cuniculi]PAV07273.1 teichoic acid ABC transporter ATP-binding protein [Methanosphaera cuniculi]PWL08964.1 teichoic acids export ATP-binding protein TagH [Methanosphaera cuniculi]
MDDEVVIDVQHVGMEFNLNQEKTDNLKEYIIKAIKKELRFQSFWALKDISFQVKKGEKIGFIGLNGAGKSTLLKIIAQVMKPTKGSVKVKGSLAPLLALGAGFDLNYTGAENIFLNGSLLGHSKSYMNKKFDEIVEFSEIGEFIDVPVKNYSSGMKSRLAFSIATSVDPDILILDEVLSVGDASFQQKSKERMRNIMRGDTSLLFVSHSVEQVRDLCDKAIWLDHGNIVNTGEVNEICDQYLEFVHRK